MNADLAKPKAMAVHQPAVDPAAHSDQPADKAEDEAADAPRHDSLNPTTST